MDHAITVGDLVHYVGWAVGIVIFIAVLLGVFFLIFPPMKD